MSRRTCKFYARGKCFRGEQCDYSHHEQDTPVDVCTFYRKGHCSYGSKCRYKHVKASQASPASSSETGQQSVSSKSGIDHTTRGKSRWIPKNKNSARIGHLKHINSPKNGDVGESSNPIPSKHIFCTYAAASCPLGKKCLRIHGDQCLYCRKFCLHPADQRERENHLNSCDKKEKYNQALNDSQEIECNICLERVLSKPKASECKFGLLPECDHAFCLSCIRNWRNSASNSEMEMYKIANNNNTVRTCPVCRKLSYFVIPSPIWYSTKEEKKEIIDNYKANCKLIDCKHFDSGNGNCPFGARCFYKHTVKPGSVMWRHGRPPPRHPRAQNNMDMYEMMDMLSEFDLESGEFYSIMRDTECFENMDPYEMLAVSDMLASSGSGPRFFDDEDSDEEVMGYFEMAALSAALDGPFDEDFDGDELNPSQAAFLSMLMQSNMEEDSEEDEDD